VRQGDFARRSDLNPVAVWLPAADDIHAGRYLRAVWSYGRLSHRVINAERDDPPFWGHSWAGIVLVRPVTVLLKKKTATRTS